MKIFAAPSTIDNISRQDVEHFYDEAPRLAARMKPFRDLHRELQVIAGAKGLTVEGKLIERDRDVGIER